jgi:hypothetical protein
MNREVGLILIALLFGGIVLLARRRTDASTALQPYGSGGIRAVPMESGARRYQNKETRRLEYNDEGLLTFMEVIRDYTIT